MVRRIVIQTDPRERNPLEVLNEIAVSVGLLQAGWSGGIEGLVSEGGAWILIAFGLGLTHAFDADHVMALSVLATDERSGRRGFQAGLRWSAGHGVVLLCVGGGLFGLGWMLPSALAMMAERLVGLLMVGLGLYVFLDLARRRAHVHFHEHDGIGPHAHWHSHPNDSSHPREDRHHHEHAASMVGALHGLAGSAPILALLPAAARSPALAVVYLVVFGLGVALAMALVSGVLGHFSERLSRRARGTALSSLRAFSATGSIGLGVWLVLAS